MGNTMKVELPADLVLAFDGHELPVKGLPTESLVYLLIYGYNKTLQDVTAGKEPQKATELRNGRVAAIREGRMVHGGGRARKTPEELAEAALADAAAVFIRRTAEARHIHIKAKDMPRHIAEWLAVPGNPDRARNYIAKRAADEAALLAELEG